MTKQTRFGDPILLFLKGNENVYGSREILKDIYAKKLKML
jgi:hypothetical protein